MRFTEPLCYWARLLLLAWARTHLPSFRVPPPPPPLLFLLLVHLFSSRLAFYSLFVSPARVYKDSTAHCAHPRVWLAGRPAGRQTRAHSSRFHLSSLALLARFYLQQRLGGMAVMQMSM